MRLDFKILWFENQPNDVRTQVEEIEDHLRSVGFVPHIIMAPDGSQVEELGKEQELFDEYDLVVVDYDLGHPGQNGDWVAQQVRRHFGFTDIIFYSGKKPGELRKLVYEGGIDGVYCFNRPDLAEKLALHIDQVMRRLSRLEAMRGLAMGVVGRCDDELKGMLQYAFDNSEADTQKALLAELDKLVLSSREAGQNGYEKCETFNERIKSRSVTSFTLYKLALHLTKDDSRCSAQRLKLIKYNDEVLEPRNRLAHAIEARTAGGWSVESDEKPAITLADFPALRNHLAGHLSNIKAIPALIGIPTN